MPLMEICKVDTPLFKRIPTDEASNFATVWGRLLDEAVFSRSEAAWSEFFLFPKVILWAPPRGGQRLAKKAKHSGVVKSRLRRWPAERKELWDEARTLPAKEPKQRRTEAAVVSATHQRHE